MSDEPDDVGREKEVEEAFANADNHTFAELKLQPFSPARIMAAQAMGLHYGFVDPAGVALFKKTKVYPGAVRDVGVVLWLCSLLDDEVDQAARDPIGAAKQMSEWSGRMGIVHTEDSRFWEGYRIFLTIMREIQVSRTKAQKKTQAPPSKARKRAA